MVHLKLENYRLKNGTEVTVTGWGVYYQRGNDIILDVQALTIVDCNGTPVAVRRGEAQKAADALVVEGVYNHD